MTKVSSKLASGFLSAFIAVSTVSGVAQAQDGREGPDDYYAPSGFQDPWIPKEGSEQHSLIKPHEEFVKRMRNCCNLRDGRANLQERFNEGADKEEFPYIVTVTHNLKGAKLEEPVEIKIPKDKVISGAEAKATCKPHRIANKNSTCIPPSYNILWLYDNSNMPHQDKFLITNIYCYWPVQDLQ